MKKNYFMSSHRYSKNPQDLLLHLGRKLRLQRTCQCFVSFKFNIHFIRAFPLPKK